MFLRSAALATLLLFSVAAGSAGAQPAPPSVVVTIDAQQWSVSTIFGPRLDLQTQLEAQPWWGNFDLTRSFAEAVGPGLGFPNSSMFGPEGPLFVTFADGGGYSGMSCYPIQTSCVPVGVEGGRSPRHFAVAERVTVSVPEPASFALLGIGFAGMGFAAVRRRRIG
jgi:hypothetical protein